MKTEDIEFIKQVLSEQLDALLGQAGITVKSLISDRENLSDPLDRATFESEHGTMLRIRDRESKLIRKIQRALENMKKGDYGICEMCGEEIAVERLIARPVTTHCISCKTKMEAFEK